MSASLVGSEMCIRDRRTRPSAGLAPSMRRAGVPPRGGPLAKHGRFTWGPVSYTHLTLPTICSV
eukprot:1809032-Alexandrium_andersonii.AAC.1